MEVELQQTNQTKKRIKQTAIFIFLLFGDILVFFFMIIEVQEKHSKIHVAAQNNAFFCELFAI